MKSKKSKRFNPQQLPQIARMFFIALGLAVFLSLGVVSYAATTSSIKSVVRQVRLPAVLGLRGKQVNGSVVLTWTKPAKGIKFTNYVVLRSELGGKLGLDIGHPSASSTTFTDTAITSGRTYYYTVRYSAPNAIVPSSKQFKIKISPFKVKNPASTPTTTKNIELPTTTPAAALPAAGEPSIFSKINPEVAPIKDDSATEGDKKRLMTLEQLRIALASYLREKGSYPEGNGLSLGRGNYTCLNTDGWGSSDDCPYPYFGEIPADPGARSYLYSSDGNSYTITLELDGKIQGLSGIVVGTPGGVSMKK